MSHFISTHEIMITQFEADAHYAGLTDITEKAAFKEMYANTLGGFVTTDVSDAEDVRSVAKRALETNDVEQKTMLNTNLTTRLNGTGSNFAGGIGGLNKAIGHHRDLPMEVGTGEVFEHAKKRVKLMDDVQTEMQMDTDDFTRLKKGTGFKTSTRHWHTDHEDNSASDND